MNYPRIMLAAPKSGSGKTTITCGLLQTFIDRGLKPCSFKSGPDYIDPMYHRNVLGISAGNLDTFFTDDETTRGLFSREYLGDIAVIEGVMGLFDGIGGIQLQGSSYDLACTLKCPIILVVDAKGAGRSIVAQIKGFLDYDTNSLIKGVILNKTSIAFAEILKPIIEEELNIKCLGAMADSKDLQISSRHLGLILPEEIPNLKQQLQSLASDLSKGIDVDAILELAKNAPELQISDQPKVNIENTNLKLAVARDEAFCFYYKENLQMIEDMGIQIVEFSPIHDSHLPEGISGLLLGGGYPENYLEELSKNITMKNQIKEAYLSGLPTLAECGGFMYLMDEIESKEGKKYQMAGAVSGRAFWMDKLVRFGYVTIENSEGLKIKGHEFHYFDTDNNGEDCMAKKPTGNRSWQCIHHDGKSYLGFPHLYYPSAPEFLTKFVEAMKKYGGK